MARGWFCFERLLALPFMPVRDLLWVLPGRFCGRELFWCEFAPESSLRVAERGQSALEQIQTGRARDRRSVPAKPTTGFGLVCVAARAGAQSRTKPWPSGFSGNGKTRAGIFARHSKRGWTSRASRQQTNGRASRKQSSIPLFRKRLHER